MEIDLEEIKNFSIDINKENEQLKQQNSKLLAITTKVEEQSSLQTAKDNFRLLLENLGKYLTPEHLEDFLEREINYYTPNLQKKWNSIKRKNGFFLIENRNLWKENENLNKKNNDFEKENEKLNKKVRSLSNQNYRLQGDFADLEEKYRNLWEEKNQKKTIDISKLTRENAEVVNSNSKLSEAIIKKDEEIDRIRNINCSLSNNLADEKRKREITQNELEFSRQNEISQEKQLETFKRSEIELERITEKLEEELEKDREFIERAKAILAFNGLSLTPTSEEKKVLGEELRKISENWISRSSSISSLKDKMPKSPFSSLGKNDSYFNLLPKASEEKNNNIIFPKLLTAEPSSIFEEQENNLEQLNQDLDREEANETSDDSEFIDSNISILDNQEISEESGNISCDDYEALKKEKDELEKELMITKRKLRKADFERDKCRSQEVESKEISSLRTKQLNNTEKEIEELKEEIKRLKENSEVFANQQNKFTEETSVLTIDNINQNLEKREEFEAVIETIIVRN
ncbi:MAG: Chromosome partition protein Smc [Mycoplasmataceae bacterium]|nr:MAG: Chromosome partition protein Smc [Mycoplasmataceae bacterium]